MQKRYFSPRVHLSRHLLGVEFAQILSGNWVRAERCCRQTGLNPLLLRFTRTVTSGHCVLSGDHLTLSEVVEMREKDVSVVARGEPLKVVFGHLAQLLPIDILEQ